MIDLVVAACGMTTSVGLSAPAACAAIRCGLTNFNETRFMDGNGQWLVGAEVPLEKPWRGRARLSHLAALAVKEAAAGLDANALRQTPLVLCLARPERPGCIQAQVQYLLREIGQQVGTELDAQSMVIANDRVGGVQAIARAHDLLATGRYRHCLVAGVDTYLTGGTLAAYEKENRLLTEENSDGFIPGEAGVAVLLSTARQSPGAAIGIQGWGVGQEPAHLGADLPLRGDGLAAAIKNALAMAGKDLGDLDFRICDLSGEQYYFKEAALALLRTLRKRKEAFDIWHPAECIGETGAAIVPVMLAVAAAAVAKGYSKGPGILCHCANDDGGRGAIVLNARQPEANG